MQIKLIINGVDFTPWIMANGLQQTEIVRKSKSIVTMDGTLYKDETVKRGISVKLVELRDATWYRLAGALADEPAKVEYQDDRLGNRTADFYVTAPSAVAKTVRGGITYFSGGTFTLEER